MSIIFKVHFTLNLFIKSLIGNYKYVVLLHIHLWLMKSFFCTSLIWPIVFTVQILSSRSEQYWICSGCLKMLCDKNEPECFSFKLPRMCWSSWVKHTVHRAWTLVLSGQLKINTGHRRLGRVFSSSSGSLTSQLNNNYISWESGMRKFLYWRVFGAHSIQQESSPQWKGNNCLLSKKKKRFWFVFVIGISWGASFCWCENYLSWITVFD